MNSRNFISIDFHDNISSTKSSSIWRVSIAHKLVFVLPYKVTIFFLFLEMETNNILSEKIACGWNWIISFNSVFLCFQC